MTNPFAQVGQRSFVLFFVFLEATAVRDSLKVASPKASDLHQDALLQAHSVNLEMELRSKEGFRSSTSAMRVSSP